MTDVEDIEPGADDFLFTWKPDKWDYENLKKLIDGFEADGAVVQAWRCLAHRKIHPGARAYLYNQGAAPNGIFAVGKIIDPASARAEIQKGEGGYEVPIKFDLILDPTKGEFLMNKERILSLAPSVHLNTQASGISFPAAVAREVDALLIAMRIGNSGGSGSPESASLPGKQERLSEVYERDQSIVQHLKTLYQGRCQVCDSVPFNGHFGDIVEGHHVKWLCRGGADVQENVVLVCPNHHAAIHASDPDFDWSKLEFRFGSKNVPIRHNRHLKRTGEE